MQNNHSNSVQIDYNSIVESLYKEFSIRNQKEFEEQKAMISESYNAKNSFYSSAHRKAIFKAEFGYIQRLMDNLLGNIEKEFPDIPLNDFKKKLVSVISREYEERTPALLEFAKGISRGGSVDVYMKQITTAKQNAKEILDTRCKLREAQKTTTKNMVFISHAKEDENIAIALKNQIDKVFGKGLTVFVSSIPGAIPPGSDWFNKILNNLNATEAFIVLITQISKLRHFVWFEIGFSWLRRHNEKCEMYALCVPPIDTSGLPEPLCRLQATSLANEDQSKAFFKKLVDQFNLGNLDTLELDKISESLQEYPTENIPKESSNDTYDGLYANYSDKALKQVLFDILSKEQEYNQDSLTHSDVFEGKLIDFRKFDQQHSLPPGTSRQNLQEVAEAFELEVEFQDENTIRFKKQNFFIV